MKSDTMLFLFINICYQNHLKLNKAIIPLSKFGCKIIYVGIIFQTEQNELFLSL